MKKVVLRICSTIVMLACLGLPAHAQELQGPLAKVAQVLECTVNLGPQKWNHQRVPPIMGSKDVLIESWDFDGGRARVAILLHRSEAEAMKALQQFAAARALKEKLQGLGDEAYGGGFDQTIAFRKGDFSVSVSAVVLIAGFLPALDQAERTSLEGDLRKAMTRNFAVITACVLSNLNQECPPRTEVIE